MSHLICLLARAGGLATRWDGAWLAEAVSDGQSDMMGTRLPSNDDQSDRTVTPLPSNDGQSDRTAAPLPSNDGQSDRTVTPLPSICRSFESLGAVLAPKRPFWHLFTLRLPARHACPPI